MHTRSLLIAFAMAVLVIASSVTLYGKVRGAKAISTVAPSSESTEDIGARFPASKVRIEPTALAPSITKERAVMVARDLLKTHFGVSDPASLPTKATVGLFTGETHDGSAYGSGIKAWVVVIENVPFAVGSGPVGSSGSSDVPRKSPPQYNVVVDAETGQVLHSVMSGRVIAAP